MSRLTQLGSFPHCSSECHAVAVVLSCRQLKSAKKLYIACLRPKGALQLGICGRHHVLATYISLSVVIGYFPDLFPKAQQHGSLRYCCGWVVSDCSVQLTFQGKKTKNVSGKIMQYPTVSRRFDMQNDTQICTPLVWLLILLPGWQVRAGHLLDAPYLAVFLSWLGIFQIFFCMITFQENENV